MTSCIVMSLIKLSSLLSIKVSHLRYMLDDWQSPDCWAQAPVDTQTHPTSSSNSREESSDHDLDEPFSQVVVNPHGAVCL